MNITIIITGKNEPQLFRLLAQVIRSRDEGDSIIVLLDRPHIFVLKMLNALGDFIPGVRIVSHELTDFATFRNFGLAMVPMDTWGLWLDADEWVSERFIPEIKTIAQENTDLDGIGFARLNTRYADESQAKLPTHSNWECGTEDKPDYQLRFYRRSTTVHYTKPLHEIVTGLRNYKFFYGPDRTIIHHKLTADISRMGRWYRDGFNNMNRVDGIDGWFRFSAAYDHLLSLMPTRPVIAEIGSFFGASTAYLASRIGTGGRIIAVDHFSGSHDILHLLEQYGGNCEFEFLANMHDRDVLGRIAVLPFESTTAAELISEVCLDGAFLDAAHDYDSVHADICAWRRKVKPGGILAGHDYSTAFGGLVRAVDELLPEHYQVEDCWFWYKK